MASITLEQANKIIEAILKRGAEMDCRPISAVVVEPGCIVKAFQKEDGSSMIRFEMAFGKAYAALALGRSSKLVRIRADERPIFMRYLLSATGDQIFPEGGGLQIRNDAGDVINNGTSGGTGMGQAYRGAERFLKPGEKMVAAIEGIGSITMPVVSEPAPPGGTGSRLPPVSSYRKQ